MSINHQGRWLRKETPSNIQNDFVIETFRNSRNENIARETSGTVSPYSQKTIVEKPRISRKLRQQAARQSHKLLGSRSRFLTQRIRDQQSPISVFNIENEERLPPVKHSFVTTPLRVSLAQPMMQRINSSEIKLKASLRQVIEKQRINTPRGDEEEDETTIRKLVDESSIRQESSHKNSEVVPFQLAQEIIQKPKSNTRRREYLLLCRALDAEEKIEKIQEQFQIKSMELYLQKQQVKQQKVVDQIIQNYRTQKQKELQNLNVEIQPVQQKLSITKQLIKKYPNLDSCRSSFQIIFPANQSITVNFEDSSPIAKLEEPSSPMLKSEQPSELHLSPQKSLCIAPSFLLEGETVPEPDPGFGSFEEGISDIILDSYMFQDHVTFQKYQEFTILSLDKKYLEFVNQTLKCKSIKQLEENLSGNYWAQKYYIVVLNGKLFRTHCQEQDQYYRLIGSAYATKILDYQKCSFLSGFYHTFVFSGVPKVMNYDEELAKKYVFSKHHVDNQKQITQINIDTNDRQNSLLAAGYFLVTHCKLFQKPYSLNVEDFGVGILKEGPNDETTNDYFMF